MKEIIGRRINFTLIPLGGVFLALGMIFHWGFAVLALMCFSGVGIIHKVVYGNNQGFAIPVVLVLTFGGAYVVGKSGFNHVLLRRLLVGVVLFYFVMNVIAYLCAGRIKGLRVGNKKFILYLCVVLIVISLGSIYYNIQSGKLGRLKIRSEGPVFECNADPQCRHISCSSGQMSSLAVCDNYKCRCREKE